MIIYPHEEKYLKERLEKLDNRLKASLKRTLSGIRYLLCVTVTWLAGIYAGFSFLVLLLSDDIAGIGGFFSLAYYLHVMLPVGLAFGTWYIRRKRPTPP